MQPWNGENQSPNKDPEWHWKTLISLSSVQNISLIISIAVS